MSKLYLCLVIIVAEPEKQEMPITYGVIGTNHYLQNIQVYINDPIDLINKLFL